MQLIAKTIVLRNGAGVPSRRLRLRHLFEHINRFPRAQRGLLGRVILDDALRMLVVVTVANRRAAKSESLEEASGRLDALRITLRLSKRLG